MPDGRVASDSSTKQTVENVISSVMKIEYRLAMGP